MPYAEKESDIQSAIFEYLRLKGYVVFKGNSTQFGVRDGKPFAFRSSQKGVADIIGCGAGKQAGRFIAIEVKKRDGYPTPEQVEFLESIRRNRGIACLAYSLDDVIREIESPGTVPLHKVRSKKPRKNLLQKKKSSPTPTPKTKNSV